MLLSLCRVMAANPFVSRFQQPSFGLPAARGTIDTWLPSRQLAASVPGLWHACSERSLKSRCLTAP